MIHATGTTIMKLIVITEQDKQKVMIKSTIKKNLSFIGRTN